MSFTHEVDFQYTPHPRVEERATAGPPMVIDAATPAPDVSAINRFNTWLAIKITTGVGTMSCAFAFALIALVGLPQAIHETISGSTVYPLSLIAWVAQTFLQLVLLHNRMGQPFGIHAPGQAGEPLLAAHHHA